MVGEGGAGWAWRESISRSASRTAAGGDGRARTTTAKQVASTLLLPVQRSPPLRPQCPLAGDRVALPLLVDESSVHWGTAMPRCSSPPSSSAEPQQPPARRDTPMGPRAGGPRPGPAATALPQVALRPVADAEGTLADPRRLRTNRDSLPCEGERSRRRLRQRRRQTPVPRSGGCTWRFGHPTCPCPEENRSDPDEPDRR